MVQKYITSFRLIKNIILEYHGTITSECGRHFVNNNRFKFDSKATAAFSSVKISTNIYIVFACTAIILLTNIRIPSKNETKLVVL